MQHTSLSDTYDKKNELKEGFLASIPIVLGYFFVSIGVGMFAFKNKITPFQAGLMSFLNLTSAGEISAIKIFGESGGYLELLLAQIVINARYALMGISLSQKSFSKNFKTKERLITSYCITDEIFAVLIARKSPITMSFVIPLMAGPILAWSTGTIIGNVFGSILPIGFASPFSILIYTMLLSIIVPEAKKSKPSLFVISLSAAISCAIYYFFKSFISSGYSIIISSLASSIIAALLFPVDIPEKEENR